MARARILAAASALLALLALGPAESGPPTVTLGGHAYLDATSVARQIGAKVERAPDRLYLRTRGRVVTLTRGWARVEVDGRPVVLEAPVRVEGERWLVPEAFTRQVIPIVEGRAPAPAPRSAAASAATPAVRTPVAAASGPAPAAQAPAAASAKAATVQAPVAATAPAATVQAPAAATASATVVQAPAAAAAPAPAVQAPAAAAASARAALAPTPVMQAPAAVAPAPVSGVRAPARPTPVVQPPAAAAAPSPVVQAPAAAALAPAPAIQAPIPMVPAPAVAAPASASVAQAPAASISATVPAAPAPLASAPAAQVPSAAVLAPSLVSPPQGPAPAQSTAPAPVRALDSPPTAPRSMVIEAPSAALPVIARATPQAKMAPPAPPVAPKPAVASIEDVRLRSYPTFTRLVVETSAMVKPRVEVMTSKELRLRFTSVSGPRRVEEVHDGLLEAVHVEPGETDTVLRVSFTGSSQEPKTTVLSDPPRLLLDFSRAPEPGPRTPLAAPGPLRTLVLDAGHGGHDSGAVGPGGLMEKELVLDVTRRVARLVESQLPGIKVLLSRKSDTFVALRERTSFANRERADLFVSIHANAHREMTSEGVETYFLSSEATDSAARQVAAAENSVVKLEKQPAARGSRADTVKAILWDLAQSDFQQESSRLAEVVQDSMTQSLKLPNRGVKQAGFYVLGGAAMPAILVEIGFVTNPREERRLKDSAFRDEIARAIFAGISEYQQDVDRRASRAAAR